MKRLLCHLTILLTLISFSLGLISQENKTIADNTDITQTIAKAEDNKQDSFLVEIEHLKEKIKLTNQKIELIEKLRSYYLGSNETIPTITSKNLDKLCDSIQIPLTTGFSRPKYQDSTFFITEGEVRENLRQKQEHFMNKIFKKFTLDFNHKIKDMMYLPTKSTQRTAEELATSSLILFLTANSNILVYNLNGLFLHSFSAGHKVKRFTVNTNQDDYFVATLGTDNTIRVFTIITNKTKMEPPPLPENPGEKPIKRPYVAKFVLEYSSTHNYTYDLETNAILKEDENLDHLQNRNERNYGSISFILAKSLKFFSVVDENGSLILFDRNGKYKGQFKFPNARLLSIQKFFPNPIYATEKAVGFFNPNSLEITGPYCDPPGESIIKLEIDQFSTSHFYALLESGDVLLYEIRQSGCKKIAKRSIHPSPQDDPQNFNIFSIKSFLLMQSNIRNPHIIANNITDAAFINFEDIDYYDITLAPVNVDSQSIARSDYITQRSSFTSSSIGAYFEYKNGSSTFMLYEISMPPKPSNDWLSNFRLPIVFIAVLLAIGYQFWSKKKKKDDEEVMQTLSKFGLQEGGKGGPVDFASLKNSIDSMSRQGGRRGRHDE